MISQAAAVNKASMGLYINKWKVLREYLEKLRQLGFLNDFGKKLPSCMLGDGKACYL
jgi:ADP-glucose pyrophosphorylase